MGPLFYLGCPEPSWLRRLNVPLFISYNRLRRIKGALPAARCRWALDSGGFSIISQYGGWNAGPSPRQYAAMVHRYAEQIGRLDWAAPQDWMCEPDMLRRTGLSITEHQARTVGNFLDLRALAPDLPIIPVIQGWCLPDYLACVERYAAAGIDLRAEPTVGLGSVCRRQNTREIAALVTELAGIGLTLHGFGVKTTGLAAFGHSLASADSQSWSKEARSQKVRLPGCSHRTCNYCPKWAVEWRRRLLERLAHNSFQPSLFS